MSKVTRKDLVLIARSSGVQRMMDHPFSPSTAARIDVLFTNLTLAYENEAAPLITAGTFTEEEAEKECSINIIKLPVSLMEDFKIKPKEVMVFNSFVDFGK